MKNIKSLIISLLLILSFNSFGDEIVNKMRKEILTNIDSKNPSLEYSVKGLDQNQIVDLASSLKQSYNIEVKDDKLIFLSLKEDKKKLNFMTVMIEYSLTILLCYLLFSWILDFNLYETDKVMTLFNKINTKELKKEFLKKIIIVSLICFILMGFFYEQTINFIQNKISYYLNVYLGVFDMYYITFLLIIVIYFIKSMSIFFLKKYDQSK